jgi:hypothetical protein
MSDSVEIAYDKADLRRVLGAFKAMDEEATKALRQNPQPWQNLRKVRSQPKLQQRGIAASRIAQGSRVSKSSKIGELSYGFAGQKFSGGGTTQMLWGGNEFGSNTFRQFPIWSGRTGGGSTGWFIYPTLRAIQPDIINKWENAFDRILKEF